MRDISEISALLRTCWHATNDPILGRDFAIRTGRRVYSRFNLAMLIIRSRLAPRTHGVLVATAADGEPIGFALAQRDEAEIVLYMLYVHPKHQGRGVGSALLAAVCARHPDAKAVRLEVLKGNARAIAWYQANGFEAYGENAGPTGAPDVGSMYMDKQLKRAI